MEYAFLFCLIVVIFLLFQLGLTLGEAVNHLRAIDERLDSFSGRLHQFELKVSEAAYHLKEIDDRLYSIK
jgi:hypothetical protein